MIDVEIPIAQPIVKADAIQARAKLYGLLRQFFNERHVLEVVTPLLTDAANAQAIAVTVQQQLQYLQTQPLSVMQSLVSSLGSIYQICKIFRNEQDRKHAVEFSALVWCHPQLNLLQMMQEVSDLLTQIFGTLIEPKILSYKQAFMHRLDINPLTADLSVLKDSARRVGLNENLGDDPVVWLDWLFTHFVEPTLGMEYPVYLTDLPMSSQPLAAQKLDEDSIQVADGFELYMDGLSIANAYTLSARQATGITMGIDRLLMVLLNTRRIDKV